MIQLPVHPKNRRRLSLRVFQRPTWLAMLVCMGLAAAWQFKVLEQLQITDINFNGHNKVSEASLKHLSNIHKDSFIWTLDAGVISSNIETHPWIRKANVTMEYPNSITIEIEEQKPILLLATKDFWYLNENGTPFRLADPKNVDYPVLSGFKDDYIHRTPKLGKRIISDALAVYHACSIPLLGGADNISEINFDSLDGFSLYLRNGSQIILGFHPPASRIDRLRTMMAKGLDLSFPQRIELDAERIALVTPITSP